MGTWLLGFGSVLWESLGLNSKKEKLGILPTSFSPSFEALSSEPQPGEQRLQAIIHLHCVGFVFKDKKILT